MNLPNLLTLFRIFLVPFLVVALLTKFDAREYVGLLIFWAASLTDFFDGWIARRRGQVTTLGQLLDPIADKLLVAAAFISLVQNGLAPAWMVVAILGREFAVDGLRMIAIQRGITIPASPLGKMKMVSQVVAISLLISSPKMGDWYYLGTDALWFVVVFALGSGLDYFVRFWKKLAEVEPSVRLRRTPTGEPEDQAEVASIPVVSAALPGDEPGAATQRAR